MSNNTETVILIHGLWMRGLVLLPHERWLRAEGFVVRRFSYPSWQDGLSGNVKLLASFIDESPGDVIHLVAHSLGGLVALTLLSQHPDPRIRRLVLMGTPYAGCQCAATAAAAPLLKALVGRTLPQWFGMPHPAQPAAVEIGVVAGTRPFGIGRLVSRLASPNDGLIAVAETRIDAARDSIALDVCHSGMLVSRACAAQVLSFLRSGKFVHG